MKARVYVTLKRSVLDPQGKAVQQALARLGFAEAADVRVGKYIEIELRDGDVEDAKARVREMCEKLLANTIIEDYRFDVG